MTAVLQLADRRIKHVLISFEDVYAVSAELLLDEKLA